MPKSREVVGLRADSRNEEAKEGSPNVAADLGEGGGRQKETSETIRRPGRCECVLGSLEGAV